MENSEKVSKKKINPLLKGLDFMDKIIGKFEKLMLGLGIIAMAINTIAAVVSRFIFNDAIIFTDELNMIFIVVVTFAGLSYAARQGRHIRMSAIYDLLNSNLRKIFMVIISTITGLFMFFLSYYAILYILSIYNSGRILPALGIHVYIIYLWVPIGFIITGLQYFSTVLKNIRHEDVYLSTNIKDGYTDEANQIEV
ncbi:Tripartite ATP-independent periplasmic transporter DctQ component [Arcobacter nitrofigilis DSM 7299]|uniref:Tripartite ATP-independent periplasmic transporter DctQ component n=1 Tax=Arcobacter nitrofigilis (strain ATCC 33309 / DSM 7299 / CCUG 15893 / LMG 7604 / NCTC 12251 / CI) TaxID=572480 RepID=D5V4H3_ARCNC|nr:TRAP transporter small permease [Arcobacter nitrofigilis]ADG92878.1 Tripartite ATP-independent periplasmic transporter DctQ component [Arcobacter nitrofigilis DSM 7299]